MILTTHGWVAVQEVENIAISSELVGKVVRGDLYFHVSAAAEMSASARTLMHEGSKIAGLHPPGDFNVVKIGRDRTKLSLLFYIDFFENPFPTLAKVCTVNLQEESFRKRLYWPSGNPPILHKKEFLLSSKHASRALFEELTESLEAMDIRPRKLGLGFKNQWDAFLAARNVEIIDHKIVELEDGHH